LFYGGFRISKKGPRNCRSLGFARDDKGKGNGSMDSGGCTEAFSWKCGIHRKTKLSSRPERSVVQRSAVHLLGPAPTFYGTVALSFVIPSEAEGSAVPRTFLGNTEFTIKQNCHLDRSVAQWRDLRSLCLSGRRPFLPRGDHSSLIQTSCRTWRRRPPSAARMCRCTTTSRPAVGDFDRHARRRH